MVRLKTALNPLQSPPVDQCPQEDYTDPTGVIISPNHPNDYFDNADCSYRITVVEGMAIQLEFTAFNTEARYDTLRIYDGATSDDDLLAT